MLIVLCLLLVVSASCLEPRIIGGKTTTIDKHPYQVSIHYNGALQCGGSIISNRWILTAAHCVYEGKPSLFKIRIGSTHHQEGGILISDITTIISHEFYDEDTFDYDVALIKLPTSLSFNKNVKITSLATSSTIIKTGAEAIVAGWGRQATNGPNSKVLQVVTLPIVDQDLCRKIYGRHGAIVTSNMFCAGYTNGEKDTCQGDSGGPLVYNGVQIGIVSWGAQCGSARYPGVYTRVSAIRSWITKRTNV